MRVILANQDQIVADWVSKRIPIFEFGSTPYTAIGLADRKSGTMLAGVVYQNYTKVDIHMHVAAVPGAQWMTRTFLGEVFRYPFLQLGVRRITGLVPAENDVAARFDEHIGFTLEGRIRQLLPHGEDVLVYGMLKEECRFLKLRRQDGYANRTDEFKRSA